MSVDATRYGRDVATHGLSPTHEQVIAWVPRGARVLELGCASGYTGRVLIEDKGCEVVGVEIDGKAAAEARANGLTVLEGSLNDPSFRASLRDRFDVVLAADLIEHLVAPEAVLEAMKGWLKPHGVAIVATPNIATWQMRYQLFFSGKFEYQDTGILDRTHVHLFTWNTLHKTLKEQGWTVEETMIEGWDVPGAPKLLGFPRRGAERSQNWAQASSALGRWSGKVRHDASKAALRACEKLVIRVALRWPNLCAYHVALLLKAPQQ